MPFNHRRDVFDGNSSSFTVPPDPDRFYPEPVWRSDGEPYGGYGDMRSDFATLELKARLLEREGKLRRCQDIEVMVICGWGFTGTSGIAKIDLSTEADSFARCWDKEDRDWAFFAITHPLATSIQLTASYQELPGRPAGNQYAVEAVPVAALPDPSVGPAPVDPFELFDERGVGEPVPSEFTLFPEVNVDYTRPPVILAHELKVSPRAWLPELLPYDTSGSYINVPLFNIHLYVRSAHKNVHRLVPSIWFSWQCKVVGLRGHFVFIEG